MGTDHSDNRSSAFTPEQLATINAQANALVRETITQLFASLAPTLKDMAITPEKLREASRPWVDPAVEERQKREMALWKADEEERLKNERRVKDACRHLDPRGQTSIRLVRNFPDRQARGLCMLCHDLIHPKEWRIGPPDKQNPRGKAYLVEPHKDYMTVVHIIAHE
jgi:hypothetical protein